MVLDPLGQELLSQVEAKLDPYTIGHQFAVARLCVAIGRRMGLDLDTMLGLQMGAAIHDLGKASIPLDILHKQTPLTDEDWELIRRHPDVGGVLAEEFDCVPEVVEMIRQHHERLDGTGYPRGLRAEEIMLEARIIAVADTFEAAGFTRPYRRGMGSLRAMEIIDRGRGTQYDPDVIDALHGVLANGFSLAGEPELDPEMS